MLQELARRTRGLAGSRGLSRGGWADARDDSEVAPGSGIIWVTFPLLAAVTQVRWHGVTRVIVLA